jgi:tetratricopeptide (TPR) repeat protein
VDDALTSVIHEELARRKNAEKWIEKGNQGEAPKISEDELRELTFDHLAFDRALDKKPIVRASEDAIQKLWDSSKYDELLAVCERIIAERKWERSKVDASKLAHLDETDAIPRVNAEFASNLKSKVFLLRAAALARLDRAADAILAADTFMQVAPDATAYKREISVIKSSCLGRLGKFDEAIALVDEIIEMEQPPPVQSGPLVSAAMRAYLEDDEDVGFNSKETREDARLKQQREKAQDEPKTCDKEPFLLKAQLLVMAERFDQAIGAVY